MSNSGEGMDFFFFSEFDGDDRRGGFGKTGFYPPHTTSSKNSDKSDTCPRREHPPYDVSRPKREERLTIEI
jgi:hypothetical protein